MEKLTHWKKLHNPDYLGAYALDPDTDLIVTIREIKKETVIGVNGKKEECSVMYFEEKDIKPMIVNATNFKMMEKLLKSRYIEKWYGKKIQLYADYNIRFGSETVEGLRIRDFLPKIETLICGDCKKNITPAGKMTAEQLAEYTQRKYGSALCAACASATAEAAKSAAVNPLAEQTEAPDEAPITTDEEVEDESNEDKD